MKKLYKKIVSAIVIMMIIIITGCNNSEEFAIPSSNDFELWAENIIKSEPTDERYGIILQDEYTSSSDRSVYDYYGDIVVVYDYNLEDLKSWRERAEGKNRFSIGVRGTTASGTETNNKFDIIINDFVNKFCSKKVGAFCRVVDHIKGKIGDTIYEIPVEEYNVIGDLYLLQNGRKCLITTTMHGLDYSNFEIEIFK